MWDGLASGGNIHLGRVSDDSLKLWSLCCWCRCRCWCGRWCGLLLLIWKSGKELRFGRRREMRFGRRFELRHRRWLKLGRRRVFHFPQFGIHPGSLLSRGRWLHHFHRVDRAWGRLRGARRRLELLGALLTKREASRTGWRRQCSTFCLIRLLPSVFAAQFLVFHKWRGRAQWSVCIKWTSQLLRLHSLLVQCYTLARRGSCWQCHQVQYLWVFGFLGRRHGRT